MEKLRLEGLKAARYNKSAIRDANFIILRALTSNTLSSSQLLASNGDEPGGWQISPRGPRGSQFSNGRVSLTSEEREILDGSLY